jgi:glycerate dehydrogenase
MKIVVLDGFTLNPGDNPWTELKKLGEVVIYERTPPEDMLERSAGAQILVTNKVEVTREHISQLPDLKFIAVTATGFNCVDVEAARERSIPVSNVPTYGTDSVAQFVFAFLLTHCHHVVLHDQAVKAREWSRSPDFCFWKTSQIELAGKTIGIIGFGRIGRRVGEIAHAFGMNVLAYDVKTDPSPGYSPFEWSSVKKLVNRSDVVTLHCALTAENMGMINKGLLEQFKPGAYLINTSRGPLVNEHDLAEALNTGQLAGAAVDVVSSEPIQPDNPLLAAKNCLITPHIAWATLSARRRLMETTVSNISNFIAGTPTNVVN